MGRQARNIFSKEEDVPCGGRQEPAYYVKKGCFPRSVRPEQDSSFPSPYGKVNIAQNLKPAEMLRDMFYQERSQSDHKHPEERR